MGVFKGCPEALEVTGHVVFFFDWCRDSSNEVVGNWVCILDGSLLGDFRL